MKKTTKVKKKKNAFSVFFGLSNGLASISGHCLKCFRSLTALVAKMMEKKNPLCVLHAIYKGCFTSRKRQSVFESLAKANAAKSKRPSEKENETEEEYMEPAKKKATRSQEVSFYSMNFIQLTQNCNMFCFV